MASTLAPQCSTNWAMKTHTLRAGQFFPSSSKNVKEMKHEDYVSSGNTKLNEGMIVAVVIVRMTNQVVMGFQM